MSRRRVPHDECTKVGTEDGSGHDQLDGADSENDSYQLALTEHSV
jgi:hypothetical protein